MEPVRIITGRAVPLDRSDVDTDQIIPSDWLKRVERTGFDRGLFSEWRDDRNFVLNDERYQGANILVAARSVAGGRRWPCIRPQRSAGLRSTGRAAPGPGGRLHQGSDRDQSSSDGEAGQDPVSYTHLDVYKSQMS